MMQGRSRPFGVTILAVVQILIGIVGVLASLAIIGLSALLTTVPTIGGLVGSIGLIIGGIVFFFSLIWLATGVGFLHGRGWAWTLGMIFSILSLIGAIGALTIGLITGGIVGSIFWVLMLYYLARNHVKAFFGKGIPTNSSYPMRYAAGPLLTQPRLVANIPGYAQPSASVGSTASVSQNVGPSNSISRIENGTNSSMGDASLEPKALVSCPYCGSRLTMGSPKCMTCGATV